MSKRGKERWNVRCDIARKYYEYRDVAGDVPEKDVLAAYREHACRDPPGFGAERIAMALSGLVRFEKPAATVVTAYLEDEDAELPALAKLRGKLTVKPAGKAIIEACEEHGCDEVLIMALVFLFLDAHAGGFVLDTREDGFPEEDDADDADEVPEGGLFDDPDEVGDKEDA